MLAIESAIRGGERQAFCFYDEVRARYVDPVEIEHLDPNLCSFRNINTPEQWHTVLAEAMIEVK